MLSGFTRSALLSFSLLLVAVGLMALDVPPAVVGATTTLASAQAANTIPVGVDPSGVGVDPLTNTTYVANERSDNVSVIDGATDKVTAKVKVGSEPYGVGIDR